ncbi:glycoside hydrolase family 20 protein [Pontibacter akesuensis]|uniref:beta-N-acetylhexosaminidase n=1 Tax=Pontibacter akesuensis TaxID=388950 RepID=A0A1I7K3C1_9BACT|nr:glycoside hydrolase family 20 protein [Pontibacter akesuensis]GHA75418.1 beta-N-acetylhexosaminidase [Pontibacter akesuensis]SFU91892.1 hexosaminidase [Pontibacter akesuensis]
MKSSTVLYLLSSFFLLLHAGCTFAQEPKEAAPVSIIPKPQHLTQKSGQFILNNDTKIYVPADNAELQGIAEKLASSIKTATAVQPQVLQKRAPANSKNSIQLTLTSTPDTLGKEGYTLEVSPDKIMLAANQPNGLFWGTQTLKQLLPPGSNTAPVAIPAVSIADKPRYEWRGMHLDVVRHFFPVAFVKEYIDYLAMHKLNTFHWHLTDDQGWRIEIKKYPKLTEVGAWRDSTLIGHYWDLPQTYDDKRHGGFYTQEQIKEVVKYAQERYITVVPEIEMPGHAVAALAAYPELSCTGGPFHVESKWGIFKDVFCAGNEQTFTFLENVLTEVMALFPSEYIHIGGDESPKDRWKECPKCQQRMAQEGLKDEHELQSYFVQRMEKFVNARGRQIIGWDEILEGGLAPNATVMSWRGTKGGIEAARQKHNVVMTPGTHLYFDHYQGDRELEPTAIHGYSPLSKVYAFEPTPAELTKAEQKYILGAQANVWTEYIPTEEHVQYMVFPRIAALSEVLWTPAKRKNWDDFKQRMQQQYQRYDAMGLNYAKSAYQVRQQLKLDPKRNTAKVTFETDAAGTDMYYTVDGSTPTAKSQKYNKPFEVEKATVIKAGSFVDEKLVGQVTTEVFDATKALNQKITLKNAPHASFAAPAILVNGLHGTTDQYDGQWLGLLGTDLEAVIDLQQVQPVSKISSSYFQHIGYRVFLPTQVTYAVSEDGRNFRTVKVIESPNQEEGILRKAVVAEIPATKARYIKVIARNVGKSPEKYPSAGQKAWLMVDELTVE